MATARLIGKLGGGLEWVASGVTGPNSSTYVDVVTSPDGKITVVEIDSRAGLRNTYRVNGGSAQQLSTGLHYIGITPGQTLSVNYRSTAVRYASIEF